jgi:hypothetical protein
MVYGNAMLDFGPVLRDHGEGLGNLLKRHDALCRGIRETTVRHLPNIIDNDSAIRVAWSFRVGVEKRCIHWHAHGVVQLKVWPSLVGMVILVGGRWDGLGAESAAASALDEAIGVGQVLGCYIVLSATKPVSAT